MDRLHEYFYRHEFACKCGCGFNTVDYYLLRVLIDIRSYFVAECKIESGCRCIPHNNSIKEASPVSQHLTGRAADIKIKGIEPIEVYKYLDNNDLFSVGLGLYDTFVHVDSRTNAPARWDLRTKGK